jgi:ATP-binding cassette subfamily B protein
VLLLVSIAVTLVVIDPVLAIVTSTGFAAIYGFITWIAHARLRRNSRHIAHEQTQVIKALQEGLGGIRDVLLDSTQETYCDVYRRADQPLRRAQGHNTFIGHSPRYLVETLGIVVIAVVAYVLSKQMGSMANAVPMLGALALGALRLLPALQQSYSAWATIVGNQASLADVVQLLEQPLPQEISRRGSQRMLFKREIQLSGVRFRYSSDGAWALNDVSLTIPKGARLGIIGRTGSGKSTLVDVVMGLLEPTEGELAVDGERLVAGRVRAWQRNIAHVPQYIYIADSSIAENIAFGVPRDQIDMGQVRRAAQQAHIAEFIESRPEGYEGVAGERGIRLSGGQRQRIGIARALYKRAEVLVLDEATSALDNATEQSVLNAIDDLDRDLTILIIAHRLTTVRHCDRIVELEHGRIVNQGTYEALVLRREQPVMAPARVRQV